MRVLAICCCVLGCGGVDEGAWYVLVDGEARAASIEVQVNGRPARGALPVEVSDGALLELLTPDATVPIEAPAGTLVWVRGRRAEVVRLAIGAEASADSIALSAEPAFVPGLASALGAQLSFADGMWALAGKDVLVRSAWMGEPAEVQEARPVVRDRAPEPPPAQTTAAPGDFGLPSLVGLYRAGEESLFLDAEGGYRRVDDCAPSAAGRYWREGDRVRLEPLGLTLSIDPDGGLSSGSSRFVAGGAR
jgi:hypothetical protein